MIDIFRRLLVPTVTLNFLKNQRDLIVTKEVSILCISTCFLVKVVRFAIFKQQRAGIATWSQDKGLYCLLREVSMSLIWQSVTSQLHFPFFGGECTNTIEDKLVI